MEVDDHLLQFFTSCLFLAGAMAAMAGSWTSRRYGRKTTMTLAGACFLVGTVLVAAVMHKSRPIFFFLKGGRNRARERYVPLIRGLVAVETLY